MVRILVALAATVAGGLALATLEAQPGAGQWRAVGGDPGYTRYSPLDQITAQNVARLRVAWRRAGVDPGLKQQFPELRVSGNFRSTPVMVNGVLYAPNAVGLIRAFSPGSGEQIWEQAPVAQTIEEVSRPSPRGVDYWKAGSDERLFLVRGEFLYAINVRDGSYVTAFGEGGRVNLHWDHPLAAMFSWTASPVVVNDVVVVAGATAGAGDGGVKKEATPEDIRGFDARTGKLLWTFHVVPHAGEYGADSWGDESYAFSGDLASWCCLSSDAELGHVYIPTSAPTGINYGGHRPGDNLFSDSILALDVKTGRRVWHYQMVHHDLWDYDTVGPPTLGDITVNGRRIKALMQPSKTGFLYVFDRVTGTPVWPIEERPVPQSTVPGEHTAKTQPFPTKPVPFDRQGFTEDDLIDYTPELRARAREKVKGLLFGPLFSPPALVTAEVRGQLIMPGGWGSGNWHTGAFDPETQIYYAVSHTQPGISRAVKTDDPKATMDYATVAHERRPDEGPPPAPTPWPGPDLSIDGLPIFKGPYGRITAIDMKTGQQAWMAANGDGPRHHPLVKDLNLPPLGIPGRGAPLLTRTLLFIGEGSDAIPGTNRDHMHGRMFRAFDKTTGKVVWETELPAGTTGAPITYMHQGRQFVVVAIGGRQQPPEWIAFALP
ncbi:MAG: PQQ-binding-like beta-propeller repeat protein [Vicinamibacterales bacterium]